MNKIITISREFGSGGRELGRRLSEQLNIAYYDREIVSEISKRTKLSEQYVEHITGKKPMSAFSIHVGRTFYMPPNPVFEMQQSIFSEQCRIIEEIAKKSDCVIIGRCADYILQRYAPFRIFVYADMESKIVRCRQKASEKELFTDKEIRRKIISIDENRAAYYNCYTGQKWGDMLNYNLCINTSHTEIGDIASSLAKMLCLTE